MFFVRCVVLGGGGRHRRSFVLCCIGSCVLQVLTREDNILII